MLKRIPSLAATVVMSAAVVFWYGPSALAAANRPVPVLPEHARMAEVSIWASGASGRTTFPTFEKTYMKGASLASGDVDGDGADEIVVGAGPTRSPEVRIYETDGTLVHAFRAYEEWFQGGVRVAVGDVNGDGSNEIVTAPGPGMPPLLHVFDANGGHVIEGGVSAYAESFQGGVHVTVHDMDGDGDAEIITTPGPGGGPHVRIFNGDLTSTDQDFFAFDEEMRDGITVAVLRTLRGPQIVIGVESWQRPLVRRFLLTDTGAHLLREFYAFDPESRSGVSVVAYDVDGDGVDEIATAQNGGTAPEVRIYDMFGGLQGRYMLHDPTYRGALSMTQLDAEGDGRPELATVALAPVVVSTEDVEKKIIVNLSQQRLYAYEHGRVEHTFLISSGTYRFPTPELETTVLEKIPVKRYRWSYGPGNPNNYDLPNVEYNLRIYGPFYIHGAYWHNNFGYRMSHGCINVDEPDAEWVYHWAEVGTPVVTEY